MSADGDLSSPSKRRRTENTATNCATTASPPLPTTTTTSATTSAPTSAPSLTTTTTTTASCANVKERSSACLETCQKDSIIAQILAGTEADFGEASLCPPGVFFDDSCYSSTATATSCSFSPQDSWVSCVQYMLLNKQTNKPKPKCWCMV